MIPTQPQPVPVEAGPNLDDIFSFKILDNMLDACDGPAAVFEKILEKKKSMLSKVSSRELTAEKYKGILDMFLKKTKGY